MKPTITLLLGIFLFNQLTAQRADSKDYTRMKEALTEKIFGTPDPYFKENSIPGKYKNESAVIIAQEHTLESDSRIKIHFSLLGGSGGAKYNFFEIFREKILINDKSALEDYSQLSFRKLQGKTRGYLGKLKNYTFINIRVIKPGGPIKTVDVDESAVTLRDEKDEKKNKIAIPDLEVGDILDYYVCNYYQEEGNGRPTSLNFVLADEYPVLNYIISLQFDRRIAAEYQCINGAPNFKISPDEDGTGNVLRLVVKDVPKTKGLIWSSTYRQMPIIRLNYVRGRITRANMPDIREGQVEKAGKSYPKLVEGKMATLMNQLSYVRAVETRIFKKERSNTKSAWKTYLSAHPKANRPDSLAAFVFRYLQWNASYAHSTLETNFDNAYYPIDLLSQLKQILEFAYILHYEFDQDVDFLLLTAKNSFEWNDLFSVADLSVLARTHGNKMQYFSFADNFDYQNTVPYYCQGEKAKVYPFSLKRMMGGKIIAIDPAESGTVTLPSTDYKANRESESIIARLDAGDPLVMKVNRKVTSTGYLKKDNQSLLTIYEEMSAQHGPTVGVSDDIITRHNSEGKSAKKEEEEMRTLMQKARTKHRQDFENEIKRNFDTKAKELESYKIGNFGVLGDSPFEFEEVFSMDGWVKKAGNNYLIDIGKFIASQISVEKDQRDRKKDVYMPFPRSFSYHIELDVPDGYTAQGLDRLNSNVENETGAFKVQAAVKDKKVVVDVEKYYTRDFEPAASWPLMLNFLDKALDFNQQKILFKKS